MLFRSLLLIPVGIAYAVVYYVTFSWCIRKFDLKTPGREPLDVVAADAAVADRGAAIAAALGGAANIRSVDACTTRLRLVLADNGVADEPRLKALGARGVVRLRDGGLQVVLGPIADQVAAEVRAAIGGGAAAPAPASPAPAIAAARHDTGGIRAALAGTKIRAVAANATRVLIDVEDPAAIDVAALAGAGVRAVAGSGNRLHLIVGPGAEALGAQLKGELLPG